MRTNQIAFGFDRATDEKSLIAFIKAFANPGLLPTLVPRLSDVELTQAVDFISQLMKKHLTEEEYHRLFLG